MRFRCVASSQLFFPNASLTVKCASLLVAARALFFLLRFKRETKGSERERERECKYIHRSNKKRENERESAIQSRTPLEKRDEGLRRRERIGRRCRLCLLLFFGKRKNERVETKRVLGDERSATKTRRWRGCFRRDRFSNRSEVSNTNFGGWDRERVRIQRY